MKNIISFISKHKIVITIIILFLVSLSIYVLGHASEDIYENQIEVNVSNITMKDGTVNADSNMDANDEVGNDSSTTNKIVRNFDSIEYDISYNLKYKSSTTLSEDEQSINITRNVIVDILVPSSIPMDILVNSTAVSKDSTIGDYNYYKSEISNVDMSDSNNSVNVILSNINGKNNNDIKPIIRIREKTDASSQTVTSDNINSISNVEVENVKITAEEKYETKLFAGAITKDDDYETTIPVGIVIYLPVDTNKGIKGIEIPSGNVDIDLNINCDTSDSLTSIANYKIQNYNSSSHTFNQNLPASLSDTANVEEIQSGQFSKYTITYNNLSISSSDFDLSDTQKTKYISSKVFVFKNSKTDEVNKDINYTITSSNNDESINIEDAYVKFVGDYTTKIDFTNDISTDTLTLNEPGKSIYNYGEEFYIQNTIRYGYQKGDPIEGFTNYIKIDNDAIKLQNINSLEGLDFFAKVKSSESVSEYKNITSNDIEEGNVSIKYGVGKWEPSYFALNESAPSSLNCPSSLNGLSKEDLMNLYGGPCIDVEATSFDYEDMDEEDLSDQSQSDIIWYNTIEEANNSKYLSNGRGIILFKYDYSLEYSQSETIILLKAKAINNTSNIGNTYQVVSRGTTLWNDESGNEYMYYLSQIPRKSVENLSKDLEYVKSQYTINKDEDNLDVYEFSSGNVTYINDSDEINNEKLVNVGNTILISPFKSYISDIVLTDVYNSRKDTFYSGMTDPIEFQIIPTIYKSSETASINDATISVYMPEYLEIYEKTGDKQYDRSLSGRKVQIDNVNYTEYIYKYSHDDIYSSTDSTSGTIPALIIHAYISLTTPDEIDGNKTTATVKVKITGTSSDNSQIFTEVSPLEYRTKNVNMILRNTKVINSIAKTDRLYIDQDGTYQFNMRAANNSLEESKLSLLYILPYTGDSIGEGSKFSGSVSVSLKDSLPNGYKLMYTSENAKTLLTNELNNSSGVNWNILDDTSKVLSDITAIKIISDNKIQPKEYFLNANGITLNIITKGNKEAEKYFNNFYMLKENCDNNCDFNTNKIVSYSSNISEVSVYNRKISGYAFEDTNENGFYENDEKRLENIIVDLYRLKGSNISDQDEHINDKDELTSKNGYYKFEGLSSGDYYVKYTFDCDKYTVTLKNQIDEHLGDTSLIDSDAQIYKSENKNGKTICYAASNIVTLDNDKTEQNHIDLGLRVKREFDIKLTKYITNTKIYSNDKLIESKDYKNDTKVKLDVKNLKDKSFKITYGIEIENTKYFPGTIGIIYDIIPEGMTFDPNLNENEGWYEDDDGILYYTYLNKTLIMPGEKYHITLVLDLQTDTADDFINVVAANNLMIKNTIYNFLEIPDDDIQLPETDEDMEDDNDLDE